MSFEGFHELTGGLNVAVVSRQNSHGDDRVSLDNALFTILDREADAHHTSKAGAIRNAKLLKALDAGKIEAWFMLAAWDTCEPKILGAAIELPTVLIQEIDGKLVLTHAKYREDTCFRSDIMREIVKERNGRPLPDVGLCDYFEEERMRIMVTNDPTGKVQGGRVGEYSAHSSAMIKVMNNMGATLGTVEHPIMELEGETPDFRSRWPVDVETLTLVDEQTGEPLDYVFATNWTSGDGKQQVMATFTEAISTFTGETIIRVQFGSMGEITDPKLLEDITASLLMAGREKVYNDLKWGHDEDETSSFGYTVPLMRIHAPEDVGIISALKKLDAKVRTLGHHAMFPTFIDLSKYSQVKLCKPPARPLYVVQHPDSQVCFDIVN
jgi:hypothetical protein